VTQAPGGIAATLTVDLDGVITVLPWQPGARLLDVLLDAGLDAPYSCRQGTCGACACQLTSGEVELANNEVLEEACLVAASSAQKKEVAIVRDLKKEFAYRGDEAFLREVFLIFLDNAVKFSSPGGVVRVRLEALRGRIRIAFEDEGAGISSSDLPHIFERFYRGGSRPAGDHSGGLGLAIAQALVTAQGGTINCQSVAGQGATFTISLHLIPDTLPAAAERAAPSGPELPTEPGAVLPASG